MRKLAALIPLLCSLVLTSCQPALASPPPGVPGLSVVVDALGTDGRHYVIERTDANAPRPATLPATPGYEVWAPLSPVAGARYAVTFRELAAAAIPQPPTSGPSPGVPPSPGNPGTQPVTRPAAVPAAAPAGRLGVNLEEPADWGRSRTWIDLVRTAPGFDSVAHAGDGKAPRGPDGWPTGDFSVVLIRGACPSMAGTFTVIFKGTFAQVIPSNGARVHDVGYDAATGTTRGLIDYRGVPDALYLTFTGTNGPRHVRVLWPGYTEAQADGQIFTTEFLAMFKALRPSVIRGMDFLQTNGNPLVHWADRPTRDTPLYSSTGNGGRGAPVEDLIAIANAVGADLWLNVPVGADADYRQQLATLVARQLRPDLRVYVEFSNEVWNASFPQFKANLAAAVAERPARGFDPVDGVAAWQRVADQTATLGDVFRATMPADQVRPVLCGQGANLATIQAGLEYLARHGPPASRIWGTAVAPYAPLTPDLPLTDWRVQLLGGPHVQAHVGLAHQYGLVPCCYESGPDLSGTKVDPQGQKDPGMQAVMSAYWSAWRGDGPVLHYNACCATNGSAKVWGLTDDVTDLSQPKAAAAIRYPPTH